MNTSVYEHMGCLAVWAEPPDTDESAEKTLEFWKRVTPDRPFMGFATGRFIEVANKRGMDLVEVGLDMSKNPPITKDGILPLMTAGAEAVAYLGSACGEVNGGHVCEDFAVVQAVDPDTGEEVPDGQWGNFVITTLGRDNFLVRYDLEEAVKLDRSPCPCGETHVRGWWGGRMKDLLRTQGVSIMLMDLERSLRRVPSVGDPSLEYVVVRPSQPEAPLVVRVEANPDVTDLATVGAEASAQLSEALGVAVEVEALERDALPRAGYKATRVVDE
jgi:phenylacetate-CoA ligase